MLAQTEAAVKAEELRERMVENKNEFTFETVLSTDRNLLLLRRAKEPFKIFKKRKDVYYRWSNQYWSNTDIERLSGIAEYVN